MTVIWHFGALYGHKDGPKGEILIATNWISTQPDRTDEMKSLGSPIKQVAKHYIAAISTLCGHGHGRHGLCLLSALLYQIHLQLTYTLVLFDNLFPKTKDKDET